MKELIYKLTVLSCLTCTILILSGCGRLSFYNNQSNTNSRINVTDIDSKEQSNADDIIVSDVTDNQRSQGNSESDMNLSKELENAKTVTETEHYKLVNLDFKYYYWIYDNEHKTVKFEGPLAKCPNLYMVNDNLIKITLQAGTGIATKWGYYYDIHKDVFSRIIYGIFNETDELVAYYSLNKVVVRNIFDKTQYYKEFTDFKKPFSVTVDPIKEVEFINNGKSIKVTYLTGDNYKTVTEIFDL